MSRLYTYLPKDNTALMEGLLSTALADKGFEKYRGLQEKKAYELGFMDKLASAYTEKRAALSKQTMALIEKIRNGVPVTTLGDIFKKRHMLYRGAPNRQALPELTARRLTTGRANDMKEILGQGGFTTESVFATANPTVAQGGYSSGVLHAFPAKRHKDLVRGRVGFTGHTAKTHSRRELDATLNGVEQTLAESRSAIKPHRGLYIGIDGDPAYETTVRNMDYLTRVKPRSYVAVDSAVPRMAETYGIRSSKDIKRYGGAMDVTKFSRDPISGRMINERVSPLDLRYYDMGPVQAILRRANRHPEEYAEIIEALKGIFSKQGLKINLA